MENALRYETSGIEKLVVRLGWGQLSIESEPVEKLQIIVTGDELTVRELRIQSEDEKLLVEQPQYGLSKNINTSKWLEVVVRIPNTWEIDIDAQTVSGGINVSGVIGENMAFETLSGNIILSSIKGEEVYLRTISSSVKADHIKGEELEIRTVSGNIAMENIAFENISAIGISGKMVMDYSKPFKEAVYSTAAGDISLYIPMNEVKIAYRSLRGNLRQEGITETNSGALVKITTVTGDASIVSTKN